MPDLPGRAEVALIARRWRIEGYGLDDICQEIYLCLLDPDSDHDIKRHLEGLKKREYRRKTREVSRPLDEEDPAWLAANDVRCLTQHDIGATCLRIAVESECRNSKDRTLLKDITTGSDYASLARESGLSRSAIKVRVHRLRRHLFPRIYEEGLID